MYRCKQHHKHMHPILYLSIPTKLYNCDYVSIYLGVKYMYLQILDPFLLCLVFTFKYLLVKSGEGPSYVKPKPGPL